jgi:hypothetical protein
MQLRQEYRIMPLKRKEAPVDRLATWQAVRVETRSLVSMAMGAHGGVDSDETLFRERVATPSGEPLPQQQQQQQPGWAPDPAVVLQAAALRTALAAAPRMEPVGAREPVVDRAPAR